MARIVISEFMDERAVAQLRAAHDVLHDPALVDDMPRLLSEAATADALIVRNRTRVRGELLQALKRCRVVGRLGVGLDNIDLPGCEAAGLGMEVVAFDAMMDDDHPAFAAAGVRCAGLEEVIAMSDVVSLHVPLLDSTRGLFNAERIASMKQGSVLINTARGGIVDEVALAAALKNGHLGGAAIDVFAAEPLPAMAHFEGCPNLILTPHIAGVTAEANERVSELIAAKVLQALVA